MADSVLIRLLTTAIRTVWRAAAARGTRCFLLKPRRRPFSSHHRVLSLFGLVLVLIMLGY